jgi:hypothetical protein
VDSVYFPFGDLRGSCYARDLAKWISSGELRVELYASIEKWGCLGFLNFPQFLYDGCLVQSIPRDSPIDQADILSNKFQQSL